MSPLALDVAYKIARVLFLVDRRTRLVLHFTHPQRGGRRQRRPPADRGCGPALMRSAPMPLPYFHRWVRQLFFRWFRRTGPIRRKLAPRRRLLAVEQLE